MSARIPSSLVVAALLACFPVLPSCVFALGIGGKESRAHWAWEDQDAESPGPQAAATGDGAKASAKPGAKPSAKAASPDAEQKRERELAKKRREKGHAELELQIALAKAAEQSDAAELELEKAARAVDEAERELETFLERVRPQALAKAELEVERQAFRAEQRRQDLQQLVDDYQAHGEEFYAKRTGQIVVWRTERELEFAERGLEQQRLAMALEGERELPKKQRALEFALEQARAGLAQAEAKRARAQLESELTMRKAGAKLEDLQLEIEKLERGEDPAGSKAGEGGGRGDAEES